MRHGHACKPLQHLALADQHIARAHQYLDRQRDNIAALVAKRHDTQCAEGLLEAMKQTLSAYEAHRSLIVQHRTTNLTNSLTNRPIANRAGAKGSR
jgi:hypothetical protein